MILINMDKLSVGSYNCKHFDRTLCKLDFMKNVFNRCNFLCIQEHWLFDTQYHRFEWLCEDGVAYTSTSAMNPDVARVGRPHGGTAIIWKKNIDVKVEVINTVSPRLCAVLVRFSEKATVLLVNVYMPTDQRGLGENLCVYQDVLAEISSIAHAHNSEKLIVCGDFNTDLSRTSPQTEELKMFCDLENLHPVVLCEVSEVKYTFANTDGARSLIDHFLVSRNLLEFVSAVYPHDSIENSSDHVAVLCELDIVVDYIEIEVSQPVNVTSWYKATISDVGNYQKVIDTLIDNICIPQAALDCKNIHCKKHSKEIQQFHNALVYDVCLAGGRLVLPSCGNKNKSRNAKHNSIPGWKEHVAHKKAFALECHWAWVKAGRPSSGYLFENRKAARSDYHYAVKKVMKNEDRLRSEMMVNALKLNQQKNLWKEVNKLKGRKKTLPVVVDGVKGDTGIAEIFRKKYTHLYTSVPCDKVVMDKVSDRINLMLDGFNAKDVDVSLIDVSEIKAAVKNVACGKSDGQVGLFSDHIVHGTEKLFHLLARLFNALVVHGMMPNDMLKSVMLPIVKNKRVQSNCSDNFRAVCLQSVLCKVLDLVILNKQKNVLITSELQFGFKAKHSTALATSVLLQTVDYYIDNGGRVYGLALDATKAFDRVEYSRMFSLLIERGMNPLLIRLIMEMYFNQRMCVQYNGSKSEWFLPSNGVKQGGVLSPTLFAVYIDGLLCQLEASNIGCHVGSKFCGVIGYADDVFLLSPTQGAMDKMINICEQYADNFLIKFNGSKCQAVVFDRSDTDLEPNFYVNGKCVTCVKDIVYLGYRLKGNRSDPLISSVVSDYNRKVNAFLGDLDCLSSEVKGALYQQYCTSLYGVIFCQLYHRDFNKLNISWRKALRRMYKLPQKTHCRLLPTVTGILPAEVQVDMRFVKHIFSGVNHENSTVNYLFRLCCGLDRSVMATNFRHIVNKYKGLSLSQIAQNSYLGANCFIKKSFLSSMSSESIRIGNQIAELICIRDSLLDRFNLSQSEICDAIEYLATT